MPADKLAILRNGYREGFRNLFIVNAVLAAVACLVVVFLIPQGSVDRHDDAALRQEAVQRLEREHELQRRV